MLFLSNILWIIVGYLIGSLPWALIIGKVFFHKDIRQYGSGNLGGTNALRHLSKPAGIIIMILDALKAFVMMCICCQYNPNLIRYVGLAVCIGHCFPVFANFKGGKAVACSCGYVLGISILITHNVFFTFVIPMLVWLIVLLISGYMSLASMSGVLSAAIMGFIKYNDMNLTILVSLLAIFVIFMHRSNIKNLINGQENKLIEWKKK